MTTQYHDQLVQEYLATVSRVGADLPPHRRDDLLTDLSEHIASARADLDPETEAGVRTILSRLGEPASIVAEARLELTPPPAAPPPAPPTYTAAPPTYPAGQAPVAARRGSARPWVIVAGVLTGAVLLLCVGVIVVGLFLGAQSNPDKGPTGDRVPAAPEYPSQSPR